MNLKRRPNKFCTVVSKVSSFVLVTLYNIYSTLIKGIVINIKRFKYDKTGIRIDFDLEMYWIKIEWNEFG